MGKKTVAGRDGGESCSHHPDDKLSMRVQVFIDKRHYGSTSGPGYVSFPVCCDNVWQVPAWPNSTHFVMLPSDI